MNELAWSDGTKPQRSYKEEKQEILEKLEKLEKNEKNENNEKILFNANDLALSSDWLLPDVSKREDFINKINERELIQRVGINPFLTETSYLEDIETQQNFLIPQNSNYSTNNDLKQRINKY